MTELAPKQVGFEIHPRKRRTTEITSNTLGRIISTIPNAELLILPESFKNAQPEMVQELSARFADVPWKGQVDVNLNHSPFFKQMGRLFGERQTNLFSRIVFGIPHTVGTSIGGKLGRLSTYNPYTESLQLYKSKQSVAAYHMGRAEDYNSANHPNWKAAGNFLLSPVAAVYSWRAARNGMRHLDVEERKEAQKVLEPMVGAAVGNAIPLPIPFNGRRSFVTLGVPGLIAGHIHGRAADHNVFFNGEPLPDQKGTPVPAAAKVAA